MSDSILGSPLLTKGLSNSLSPIFQTESHSNPTASLPCLFQKGPVTHTHTHTYLLRVVLGYLFAFILLLLPSTSFTSNWIQNTAGQVEDWLCLTCTFTKCTIPLKTPACRKDWKLSIEKKTHTHTSVTVFFSFGGRERSFLIATLSNKRSVL